jgi:hypothetical protein
LGLLNKLPQVTPQTTASERQQCNGSVAGLQHDDMHINGQGYAGMPGMDQLLTVVLASAHYK